MKSYTSKQTWRDLVRNVYSSIEELEAYNEMYGIVKRCGYDSAAELWEDNPIIGGSTDPKAFGLAKDK